jgi:signal transduction histidine kinase
MEDEEYYSLSGQKILIIDDDEDLAKSIKFFFEDHECIVKTAANGEDGLRIFLNEGADVILVDLNMPKISGYEVISFVAKNFPLTPIISVSGVGKIKEAMKAIKQGAWDFITKPIMNFEELEFAVLRAFEKAFLLMGNNNYKENLEKMVAEKTSELELKSKQLESLVYDYKIAKERAEASDKLKSEFLGQVSHEIRTPLNAILSFTNLIKDNIDEKTPQDFDEYFDVINRAGARLIRTIELILNISDVNANTYNYNKEHFDLVEIIKEINIPLRFKYKNKNIEFNILAETNRTDVNLDKFSVFQALSNLIENAYKYTNRGEINIKIFEKGKIQIVEISDTGIGISEEFMPRLFDPFSQEDQGFTRKYEGNGLGLTLVKRYCDLNGISIEVNSIKKTGTTFTLTFQKSGKNEEHFQEELIVDNK